MWWKKGPAPSASVSLSLRAVSMEWTEWPRDGCFDRSDGVHGIFDPGNGRMRSGTVSGIRGTQQQAVSAFMGAGKKPGDRPFPESG